MAPVIRALPPSATGQPAAWARAVSISPTAPVGTARSGIMACAAAPANRARASGVAEPAGHAGRGPQAVDPEHGEPGGQVRRRPPDRGQQQLGQVRAVAGHRAQQPPVGGGVAAEPRRGLASPTG